MGGKKPIHAQQNISEGDDIIEQPSINEPTSGNRKAGTVGINRRLRRLAQTALDSLEQVLTDESVKATDRISAAKLVFELIKQQAASPAPEDVGTIKVVFDGCPQEYAE